MAVRIPQLRQLPGVPLAPHDGAHDGHPGRTVDIRYRTVHPYVHLILPFPNLESNAALEDIGRTYYKCRAKIMQLHNKGLTTLYNQFHNPDFEWPEIEELRELHDCMDRAVLNAYGWSDIQPRCEFIPEFDDEDDDEDNGHPRRTKYRYRWPDEIRDVVLARLLEPSRNRRRRAAARKAASGRARIST